MAQISPDVTETAVVIVAAGSGQRLGHGIPKALVHLGESTILEHALAGVEAWGGASSVVVAVPADDDRLGQVLADWIGAHPELDVRAVAGGSTRAESVASALAAIGPARFVLVHDAARPLVPTEVFDRVVGELRSGAQAVIPAVKVTDTIKSVQANDAGEVVTANIARDALRAVQTPQGFDAQALIRAHHEAVLGGGDPELLTDDAMLMESTGVQVSVVAGSHLSLKITTPIDLLLAEAILAGGRN